MKQLYKSVAWSVLVITAGVFAGAAFTKAKVERRCHEELLRVLDNESASRLSINHALASFVFSGDTNNALQLLVTKIDADLVRLTERQRQTSLEAAVHSALASVLSYRSNNLQMTNFETKDSWITKRVHDIIRDQ